jgi:hypothetical protein
VHEELLADEVPAAANFGARVDMHDMSCRRSATVSVVRERQAEARIGTAREIHRSMRTHREDEARFTAVGSHTGHLYSRLDLACDRRPGGLPSGEYVLTHALEY